MSGAAWIKFFPSDWLTGTIGLTALEKGVYITILALIYDKGGPIPNNPKVLARRCETSPASFNAALRTLVEEGKLVVSSREIFNKKAEKIIADAEGRISKARKGGIAKAEKKTEENQSANSAQAEPEHTASTAQAVLGECLDPAIPELEPEPEKKRASKLAPKDEGEGQGDSDLEAALRHAAGWQGIDHKRLAHVQPIAKLIAQGLDLHDDVIPTIRQLAPNVRHTPNWSYFVGALEDILRRRKATTPQGTPQSPRVWVWKGTPQWDAWAATRTQPWPTTEQRHPEGGRRPGWYFDSEYPPTKDEAA